MDHGNNFILGMTIGVIIIFLMLVMYAFGAHISSVAIQDSVDSTGTFYVYKDSKPVPYSCVPKNIEK